MTCLFGKLPNDSGGGGLATRHVFGETGRQTDRQTEGGTGGKWEEGRASLESSLEFCYSSTSSTVDPPPVFLPYTSKIGGGGAPGGRSAHGLVDYIIYYKHMVLTAKAIII